MLMAAGLGTRLRPFTDFEPKALLPLMGVPMAQFAVDAAAAAGVDRVVANVHHLAERARSGLESLELRGIDLRISDESQELLGSSGGLRQALPLFRPEEPFFLLNADVLCDIDLGALARSHARHRARHGAVLTLTVFPRPPVPVGERQRETYREILWDQDTGLVTGLGDKAIGRPYFVGSAVIEPEALAGIPKVGPAEFVPTVLEPAIRAGKAGVHLAQGLWYDVGSPALWLQAHCGLIEALETGHLPRGWRARIESANKRVGSRTWVSVEVRSGYKASWSGPSYWNPMRDSTATAPATLGPRAVLYGTGHGIGSTLASGIGYRGVWSGPE